MPSLILHNSCSVDIFILCPSFISSMYEIFEINVLKSLNFCKYRGFTIEKCINQ